MANEHQTEIIIKKNRYVWEFLLSFVSKSSLE